MKPLNREPTNHEPLNPETSQSPRLRVAAFEPRSLVNGPGVRAVLWVQGCARRCPGCFNPEFLSREGGREVAVPEVLGWIEAAAVSGPEPIEGVTFSGGEPFDQAEGLVGLARAVQQRGLGVVVFTGYAWSQLREGSRPGWMDLAGATDLLVAGPYKQANPGTHPLLASGNQELIQLTGRYREAVARGGRRRVEFRIGGEGVLRMSGLGSWPGEIAEPVRREGGSADDGFRGSRIQRL